MLTIVSTVVFLADTWLHVTTTTVNFVQVDSVLGSAAEYGFVLEPNCTVGPGAGPTDARDKCAISIAATNIFLVNGSASLQTLNNVSDSVAALTYNNQLTYLGKPSSPTVLAHDFTATTFGIETQCRPVSTECNLNALFGASTPFHCTDAFQGDLSNALQVAQTPEWYMVYFDNSSMASNLSYISTGVQNPFYFGLAALTNAQGGGGSFANGETEIVTPVHGGSAFVLYCNATVYEIEYDQVNGSVTRFVTTASNVSTTNLFQGSIAATGVGTFQLQQAASLATFSTTAQELADKIALAFSRVALAVGGQLVAPAPAQAAQLRSAPLVTRLPQAPLFTLVLANLLFALLGVVFTVRAVASARGDDVPEVQARLSIPGLVANLFEGARAKEGVADVQELFAEQSGEDPGRVVVGMTQRGGYEFRLAS